MGTGKQRKLKMKAKTGIQTGILGSLGEQPITENSSAQRDSRNSKLWIGPMSPMGPMGLMGLMGQKPEMKTAPAQPDSGNSKLAGNPWK